jgi:hypothetical protein
MAPAAIVGHPGILYKIDMVDYGWVIFPLPGLISGGGRFNRFDSDNFSIKPRHLWSMNVYDFESYPQSAIWALGPAEGSSKQTLGDRLRHDTRNTGNQR